MADRKPEPASHSQSDKFKDAARKLEADEDEKRWEERLSKVARPKQEPQK